MLAIAGLIFLMVFIALPALQRNQRDTDRKNAVGAVAAAISTYIGNKGKLDNLDHAKLRALVPEVDKLYAVWWYDGTWVSNMELDWIVAVRQAKCNEDGESWARGGSIPQNSSIVVTKLESTDDVWYCQNV